MCVVAIAFDAHPRWRLIVAGNRDEYHARASAPLAMWEDGSCIIAGRDLVSGGSWMGVSGTGRFAVVTNIRDADGPNPDMLSRGALVTDWLATGDLPDDLGSFNPFNLFVTDGGEGHYLSNRPCPLRQPLKPGVSGLSNAVPDERWPRKDRLVAELTQWLNGIADEPEGLFGALGDETLPDREAHPVFIRSPVYGTRCSTVVAVDSEGVGQIIERRYGADGMITGQTALYFRWPAGIAMK